MPFAPHTEDEIRKMLDTIGIESIEQLFDEVPVTLRVGDFKGVPDALNEMQITRLMTARAGKNTQPTCFIGAGAYEHHIPAAVWEITTRGEYYSAYTPYQAEASQGTLQLLYEYQSMMAKLMAMDVSNASLYDGASGLAEAVLMAIRANRGSKSKRILMPRTVHPQYRKVVQAVVKNQDIVVVELDFEITTGHIQVDALPNSPDDFAALIIPQPNFFGVLEDVDRLTDWAHANNILVIALVNPTAAALLKPPGRWGKAGADIACGEGQPLGIPLAGGGPYFGFMCCKKALVRQMPGRIIGRTVDLDGKTGFTLTLQAREQHIRRSKATSNICTNQGLMVTAATIYMALLGTIGLQRVATVSHYHTATLLDKLCTFDGVRRAFTRPCFHEAVIKFTRHSAHDVLARLAEAGILGGLNISADYPELGEAVLVCATETKTVEDIDHYARQLGLILG
jgi:glycine cleavage system P protein (glycine dehydrogenase) subunit 1